MAISNVITLDELQKKLSRQQTVKLKSLKKGLHVAGLFLQRESQLRVPVDFSLLKGSAETRDMGTPKNPETVVLYTSAYAPFVHENVAMKLKGQPRPKGHRGVYWGPHGQSKFLEAPARENKEQIKNLMLNTMKSDFKK